MIWLFVGPSGVYLLDFLLRYSVLFTVESLSLLYLLVISWFICFRRWCIDKLGVFHANQIYICVLIHIWIKGEVGAPLNRFKPSSKIFYWPFQGGTSFADLLCLCSVLCLLCLCARLFIYALWSPSGKGLTSWLSFVVSNCEFVTFPLVSWVGRGTWLYRLLIFAPLLTLLICKPLLIPKYGDQLRNTLRPCREKTYSWILQ